MTASAGVGWYVGSKPYHEEGRDRGETQFYTITSVFPLPTLMTAQSSYVTDIQYCQFCDPLRPENIDCVPLLSVSV